VLDGVKPWAFGEHPTGEDALDLAGELDLVHLHEGRGVGRFRRWAAIADARRHLERAELHRLIDRYLQMRDAARHLVEGGEHGNRILDLVGAGGLRTERPRHSEKDQKLSEARVEPSCFRVLHHAAHLLNWLASSHFGVP
jgi:hypothetical protein